MAPKFGTSGVRGLVSELTEILVRDYTRAFLTACNTGPQLYVGQDLRPSSPLITKWIIEEALACGLDVSDCGALPTPALAFAAKGAAAIMVTGSHIPADRNGLKFYLPSGEISKADETLILKALGSAQPTGPKGTLETSDASSAFIERYETAYGPNALSDLRIGVYEHSSVARDMLVELMARLGAQTVSIARSDTFIPVDTEALDPETQTLFAGWIKEHRLDVLVSTDGDADRPMLVDESACVVPGDVLGVLTAQTLKADIICTPVSSNTQVETLFESVARTRIGSPHVVAAMEDALAKDPAAKVIGYEANGGFLLGFEAQGNTGPLAPLITRDCLLPLIAPIAAANALKQPVSALLKALPKRFTAADRLQGIPTQASAQFLQDISSNAATRAAFFDTSSPEVQTDVTDGLRVTFGNGDIVHLRPSGNAPEFRCYTESSSPSAATKLLSLHLSKLQAALN